MNILFLSVSAGGGHSKAAEAIKAKIEQKYPGSRTMVVDTFKYISPIIDKLVVGSYLNTLKTTPQIYGKLYELSEAGENIYDFSKNVNRLLSFGIKKLITEFNPSAIVCTHPFPLQMISSLKRKKKINVPAVAILTDFVTHSFWIHENIDAYVVAHDFMKLEMVNRGLSKDTIYPFGIPVSNSFLIRKSRSEVLNSLGMEDKLTVLIMGGSLGLGEIQDIFLALLRCRRDLQIIAVCGRNIKLKQQLERYALNAEKDARIFSYTDLVPDFMDAADFIITKPGGLTVAEALIKEVPMLIISPIPGQDEGNAVFLTNNGAAVRILDNMDMDSILSQIIDNPFRIRHMNEISRYLARPNASEDIVGLLELLNRKNSKTASG